MKTRIIFLCLGIILIFGPFLKAQIPTNGLVAYYPFNGNANDESGNGNNGSIHGATLTTDRCGRSDSAMYFNGFSDYIALPSEFDIPERTINVWFLADSFTAIGNVIYDSDNDNLIYGKTAISVYSNNGNKINYFAGAILFSYPILAKKWYMATIAVDADSSRFYLNGILLYTKINETGHSADGLNQAIIGASRDAYNYFFSGKIDDIRIYDRALNQNEISSLYNEKCSNLQDGLVAYYPFNNNANDESGNDNNGIVNGATLTIDRCGNQDSAYYFNGSNSYIQISGTSLALPKYTYSLWASLNSLLSVGETSMLLSIGSDEGDQHLQYTNNYGGYNGWLFGGYNSDASQFAKDQGILPKINQWYLITGTRSENEIKFFINGLLVSSVNISSAPYYGIGQTQAVIGAHYNHTLPFNGKIDDVRIYNRVLTDSEVLSLYYTNCSNHDCDINLQDGLEAFYPFNGNANDESGNMNNGIVNGATLTTDRCGKPDSAYYFNESTSYIEFPNNFDYLSRSIDLWFYADNKDYSSSYGAIYQSDNPGLLYGNSGVAIRDIGGSKKLLLTISGITDTVNVIINSWNNLAMTLDSAKIISYYYNGKFLGNKKFSGYATSVSGKNNAAIGLSRYTNSQAFQGKIDDIRIYNRVLNSCEVASLYNTNCTNQNSGLITGDNIVCQGQKGVVYNVQNMDNIINYSWTYSGKGATFFGNSESILINFADNATSGDLIVVGNKAGGVGSETAILSITVNTCNSPLPDNFNIPNSFSPNGDKINEVFLIRGLPANAKLTIFNRSGKVIYESINYQNDWDGKDSSGQILQSGTYWYVLSLAGYPTEFKGFVYIKR